MSARVILWCRDFHFVKAFPLMKESSGGNLNTKKHCFSGISCSEPGRKTWDYQPGGSSRINKNKKGDRLTVGGIGFIKKGGVEASAGGGKRPDSRRKPMAIGGRQEYHFPWVKKAGAGKGVTQGKETVRKTKKGYHRA